MQPMNPPMNQPTNQPSQPTPQQVFEEAHRLLRVGDVHEAAKRAGKLRAHFKDDIPILTLHGMVLAKMGVHPQALSDLVRAAQLTEHALQNDEDENPSRPRIVDQLIRLCVQICRSSCAIGELKAAYESIEQALKWDPDRGDAVAAKAELLAQEGKLDEAIKLIEQAQQNKLDSLPLVLSKARVLLLHEKPDRSALSQVCKELETEAQVSGLGAMDLGDLLRATGMVHDRLEEFDESFNAFRRAAKLKRGSYDPRAHTMMTTKVIMEWTAPNIAKLMRPTQSGERVVLVLGSPGSGATELANMLGQLDDIKVIGPIESLSSVCVRHLGAKQGVLRPVPLEPTKLRGAQLKDASDAYMIHINAMLGANATRAVDTHPLNIPLAGAAAAFLPGVNIVMCRRDPMESILACYCSAMVGNHPYSGDLLNAAGFVADCNRMMDHWERQLGDESVGANIVRVEYADLVKDPKKTAANVAKDIGVDAKSTSIKHVPVFAQGPASHPDAYRQSTKSIAGFFNPTSA